MIQLIRNEGMRISLVLFLTFTRATLAQHVHEQPTTETEQLESSDQQRDHGAVSFAPQRTPISYARQPLGLFSCQPVSNANSDPATPCLVGFRQQVPD